MRTSRLLIALAVVGGCSAGAWFIFGRSPAPERWLGYADADYVKVAPTQQGRLVSLSVERGDTVEAGAPLFAQDDADDRAARDQAAAELTQASEKLADLQAAGRTAEIQQARADVDDMQAAYDRVARDLMRNEAIVGSGAATRQTVDQLQADARSAQARLNSARAKLSLIADANGRAHAIAAQEAAVAATRAALASAQWRLDQRSVAAPAAGLIADTYARPGETIAAGAPVVSLLPPGNILVRFFVPETALARLHPGDRVGLACDSCERDLQAQISFVATSPEYTPPVIYSQGARGSLVYLIEARPAPDRRPLLKPGQPLDVTPAPAGRTP
jgi:HlyD family secretion protein